MVSNNFFYFYLSNVSRVFLGCVKQLPMPTGDLLIDMFLHFNNIAKQKEDYREFLKFCDVRGAIEAVEARRYSVAESVAMCEAHWP